MATIRKRNGKHVVIYDYIDEKGERRQKWKTFATKPDAQKFKVKIEHEKLNNEFVRPTEQTLETFLNEWIEIHAKAYWQFNTYTGALGMIKNHIIPTLGNKELQKITPKDVEMLYDSLRSKKVSGTQSYNKSEDELPCLSSTTIRHVHNIMKSAFDKAVEWQLISKSPVICTPPKKNVVEKKIWEAELVKTALDNIEHELLHLAVHLAFVCSLRIGEAMGLTWDMVDFEENTIQVNKTLQRTNKDALKKLPSDNLVFTFPSVNPHKKSVLILKTPKTSSSVRKCYITGQLKEELIKRKEQMKRERIFNRENYTDYNLVFALEDGSPIEPKLCEKWFKKWQLRTSLDLPEIIFHEIRHSSTTYKLQISGGDIKSVQGDTGHSTADMVVNTYAHIIDQSRAKLISTLEREFYGNGETGEEQTKSEIDVMLLLEVAKKDPQMRQMLLNALA